MAEAPVVLANSRGKSNSRYGTSNSGVNVEILTLVTRMLWCITGAMTADAEGCTVGWHGTATRPFQEIRTLFGSESIVAYSRSSKLNR